MVVTHGDDLNDGLFKEKIGKYSIREISRRSSECRNGSLGFAEVMLDIYSKKQYKSRLNSDKLYEPSANKFAQNPQDNNIENDFTEEIYEN